MSLIAIRPKYRFSKHGVPFSGSGDVKPGAFAYWSTARAYTKAYAAPGTNPVMDLVDQAGANPITVNILATGYTDIASINAWVAAHSVTTIKVKKLYDQSGNGFHVSQATLANMPILKLTHPGLGNDTRMPTMHFIQSASMTLSSGATGLSSAVGTFSVVGRVDALFGGGIIQASPFGLKGTYQGLQFYAGSAPNIGMMSDNFHCFQAIFNGASSQLCVDGTLGGTFNAGTGPLGSPFVFGQWNNGFPMGGQTCEVRFDSSAWSSADCAGETSNQKAFWFTRTSYEGYVASRCRARLTQESTNKYINSRSAHIASEALTAIKVGFESPAGSTITASVEYPAGTFTQLTFAGATSIALGAGDVFSDYATVSIPSGATFWIRQFENATSGGFIRYNTWQNSFLGEAVELSATALTDKTMSGTIANSGSPTGVSCPPTAIVGVTTHKSVVVAGDSIGHGQADVEDSSSSATGFNDVVGFIDRSLAAMGITFVNRCVPGTAISGTSGMPLHYGACSHLISQFGINDLDTGTTAATMFTDTANFAYFVGPATKFFQTTCTPRTNSSDGWLTLVNQSSFGASFDTQRDTWNDTLRAGTSGIPRLTGIIDVASVLESSLDSNKWVVTPSPSYTGDGIHPSSTAHALVVNAGIVQAAII